jgi:hypothetical protein
MTDGYVYRAQPYCMNDGCMVGKATGLLEQARRIVEEGSRGSMSAALWCDQGGHAFSERDPGRQRIRVSVLDDDETETEVAKDFCGDCAAKAGLTSPRKTRPTLPAASDG